MLCNTFMDGRLFQKGYLYLILITHNIDSHGSSNPTEMTLWHVALCSYLILHQRLIQCPCNENACECSVHEHLNCQSNSSQRERVHSRVYIYPIQQCFGNSLRTRVGVSSSWSFATFNSTVSFSPVSGSTIHPLTVPMPSMFRASDIIFRTPTYTVPEQPRLEAEHSGTILMRYLDFRQNIFHHYGIQ